ncbi:MAG: class I SAM-dependent methyltransferase [Rubrivivax sp.]|nr:class I SAM-dependent methyltransferase [Rubrivivax sp.]
MNPSSASPATTLSQTRGCPPRKATRPSPSRAERTVLSLLGRLQHGTLELHGPHEAPGRRVFPGSISQAPRAAMHLLDDTVHARVLAGGDIGLAEAYIEGRWTTPDLRTLLDLFMRNRESLERAVYGSRLGTLVHRLAHWLRRNSRRGSRRNIEAHYDLGNHFYAAWLDETMNYSSAWFGDDPDLPLAQAQQRKVRRALDAAGVGQGSRLLEIGCGWGAVAEAAARRGAEVVGVTLSREQLAWAERRLRDLGLDGAADLRLQDYRDLAAECERAGRRYDAIVSIEMLEAVGREWWPTYFDTLRRCLRDGGRACVQVITIRDDLFERYVRSTDFIQQYVFPGGLLPSDASFRAAAARAGFDVVDELAFGADYARTLAHWRRDFHAQRSRIASLGHDERFLRLWDFYLAYCEAAFATGQTDVRQYTLVQARAGGSSESSRRLGPVPRRSAG